MRILVATDAWHPQINGVVRTLTTLARAVRNRGATIEFLTPDGFPSFPLPTYPDMRCAIPNAREITRRIEAIAPEAIHIATEGPIGWAVRRYCIRRGLPFTTSYTTKFPEYISARLPIPESWSYAVLRRFHNASAVTMVSTNSLAEDLTRRGFTNIGMWTRGVDTELFRPDRAIDIGLKRPIFMTIGRVAVEKNIDAFLSLDLPGSKAIIGRGPEEERLQKQYPDTTFFGSLSDENLASHLAAADVFVFPSRTDTYGVVQLEALACGVPVAAFPVTDRRDHRTSDRGAERRPENRLSRGAQDLARGLPRLRADALLGQQRETVPLQCEPDCHRHLSPRGLIEEWPVVSTTQDTGRRARSTKRFRRLSRGLQTGDSAADPTGSS
jgi:glycosyltransferase involved in cell wall biosynthesis